MYHPTLDEFRRLAGRGNLVPVYRELPADLETPVSVYMKLRDDTPSFLLESVEKGKQLGRYSFIGVQPPCVMLSKNDRVWLTSGGGVTLEETEETDPFTELQRVLSQRLRRRTRADALTIYRALRMLNPSPYMFLLE
ncbi:MAG: hypothetical protein J7M34_14035, partial [Anaerolineae bacterium]|nr:hypothetical protein [Anaerolineae bacterium]